MNELGFDIRHAVNWFVTERTTPYTLVRVSDQVAQTWADALKLPIRRCYIPDPVLDARALETGRPKSEILLSKLPDAGATMAGDFGEILIYFYQAATEHPKTAFGPKKWRLKEARTKAAPYSDVVQFILPTWPTPSAQDVLICTESKLKSTAGAFKPISVAIEGCQKDRTSRLAKTLAWLKDRALGENLGCVEIAHIERFINATDHPKFEKRFRAVAIICSNLLNDELAAEAPTTPPTEYSLIVISVPELHSVYNSVFKAVSSSV